MSEIGSSEGQVVRALPFSGGDGDGGGDRADSDWGSDLGKIPRRWDDRRGDRGDRRDAGVLQVDSVDDLRSDQGVGSQSLGERDCLGLDEGKRRSVAKSKRTFGDVNGSWQRLQGQRLQSGDGQHARVRAVGQSQHDYDNCELQRKIFSFRFLFVD